MAGVCTKTVRCHGVVWDSESHYKHLPFLAGAVEGEALPDNTPKEVVLSTIAALYFIDQPELDFSSMESDDINNIRVILALDEAPTGQEWEVSFTPAVLEAISHNEKGSYSSNFFNMVS